jgi:hypothetical protein
MSSGTRLKRIFFLRIPFFLLRVLVVAQWGASNIFHGRQWWLCEWKCGLLTMHSKSTWSYKSIEMHTRLTATKLFHLRTMRFAWMLGILSIEYPRQTFIDFNRILCRGCMLHIIEIEVPRKDVLLLNRCLHLCLPWLSAQRTSCRTSSKLYQLGSESLSAYSLLERSGRIFKVV